TVGRLGLAECQLHCPQAASSLELPDLALLAPLDPPGQPSTRAETESAGDPGGGVCAEHATSVSPRAIATATASPPASPAKTNASSGPAWQTAAPPVAEPSAA